MADLCASRVAVDCSRYPRVTRVQPPRYVRHRAIHVSQALELDAGALAAAGTDAMELCTQLKDAGVLAKPTRETTVRFAPPLVIPEEARR